MLTPVVEAEHAQDHEELEREFQLTQDSDDTAVSTARGEYIEITYLLNCN